MDTPNLDEMLAKLPSVSNDDPPVIRLALCGTYCQAVLDVVRLLRREQDEGGPRSVDVALAVLATESRVKLLRLFLEAEALK